MENFDQIFTCRTRGYWFKYRYSETGLINILALLAILFSTGQDFRIIIRRAENNDCKGVQSRRSIKRSKKAFNEAEKQLNKLTSLLVKLK
jgi:hypothetical protein